MNKYAICFNGVVAFHLEAIGQWHAVIKATDTPQYKAVVKRLNGKGLLVVTAFSVSMLAH